MGDILELPLTGDLDHVRNQLHDLVQRRLLGALTPAEDARYRALCQQERALLARDTHSGRCR